MEFCEALKKARLSAGYSQKEAAAAVGVSPSAYCGYESGRRRPDIGKVGKLCQLFGVSPESLLGEREPAGQEPREESTEALLTRALENLGFLAPGQELSQRDFQFLSGILDLLEAWFGKA